MKVYISGKEKNGRFAWLQGNSPGQMKSENMERNSLS